VPAPTTTEVSELKEGKAISDGTPGRGVRAAHIAKIRVVSPAVL